ncbi:MAG: SMP-30/gluconolactonase/LRE family protein [Deltaproteobacteria bacterium]|nr:SMP-30/gluconolactonase/LRE family protein [Deltaproteobacteria bacterium]MBW2533144.1 SMP-30/gluconolactonase/LRE family protein [Deltaproteobacteria bacterium]
MPRWRYDPFHSDSCWIRLALAAILTLGAGCESRRKPPTGAAPTTTTPSSSASSAVAAQPELVTIQGFKTPESVLYDPSADLYLVANINGAPLIADDNGFIARVKPDGTVHKMRWIDGRREEVTLNAPKGMAIVKDVLYVADLDHLRKFDAKTGTPTGEIAIEGATFLNDVAVGPDGTVYVSDSGLKQGDKGFEPSGTDAVYRIDAEAGTATAIAKGEELGRPNGLFVDGEGVWVVTFGSGELYRLDQDGKRVDVHKLPGGSLDGVIRLANGQLIISSWSTKTIYRGPKQGPFKPLFSPVNAPADIGFDPKRNRLLVPRFNDHLVELRALPK